VAPNVVARVRSGAVGTAPALRLRPVEHAALEHGVGVTIGLRGGHRAGREATAIEVHAHGEFERRAHATARAVVPERPQFELHEAATAEPERRVERHHARRPRTVVERRHRLDRGLLAQPVVGAAPEHGAPGDRQPHAVARLLADRLEHARRGVRPRRQGERGAPCGQRGATGFGERVRITHTGDLDAAIRPGPVRDQAPTVSRRVTPGHHSPARGRRAAVAGLGAERAANSRARATNGVQRRGRRMWRASLGSPPGEGKGATRTLRGRPGHATLDAPDHPSRSPGTTPVMRLPPVSSRTPSSALVVSLASLFVALTAWAVVAARPRAARRPRPRPARPSPRCRTRSWRGSTTARTSPNAASSAPSACSAGSRIPLPRRPGTGSCGW
jgi:hypothetical protein